MMVVTVIIIATVMLMLLVKVAMANAADIGTPDHMLAMMMVVPSIATESGGLQEDQSSALDGSYDDMNGNLLRQRRNHHGSP